MKPSARIQAVIEILGILDKSPVPMDNTIRDYMHSRRYIGSKDRADIVDRVYRIIRHHARYGWWMAHYQATTSDRLRVITDMVHNGEYPKDLMVGGKHMPDALTDDESAYMDTLYASRQKDEALMPPAIQVECPPWAEEKLRALFGTDFIRHMQAMMTPAPLDLRVNSLMTDIQGAVKSLTKDNIQTTPTPFSPIGLRVTGKAFMQETKAFRSGLVDIQDEGSQLIALMTDAKPGMRVLDFCAGGGGKTLALAALMQNKGNIVAMDNNTRRLEKGKPRYRKAGIHNVEVRSLEDEQNRKWLRRQKESLDIVLVDAPCSSSGTWRRNPDLRWRFYGPSLEEILTLQADILEKIADKVKPGGRLVYATCSLFKEENEDQILSFLSRHPEFQLMPVEQAWPSSPSALHGTMLRLTPADHGTDGFFCAVMVKRPS
jgi:16S rRNA (cytosine967-C5)-methyltransferase